MNWNKRNALWKGQKWAVFSGLLFCGLLLSGCLMVKVESLETVEPDTATPTATPTQTLTPTETIVWFPATATPRPLNTPTPFPTVNELPNLGRTLLEEDFSDPDRWQTFRSSLGNAVVDHNELTLAIQKSASAIASYGSLPQYADYFLSLNVSLSLCSWHEDWYAVVFRVEDADNLYRWRFNCQGQTRVERLYQGKVYTLSDWDINGVIKPGAPQKFRIGIAAEGSTLRFYGNNTLLTTVEDPLYSRGGYGLQAGSAGLSPLTVTFSNLTISEISR